MSAQKFNCNWYTNENIIKKLQAIRSQIVDCEILTKSTYDDATPLKIKGSIEQLKQNIFDLDITITNRLVE